VRILAQGNHILMTVKNSSSWRKRLQTIATNTVLY
jgi:hypothetical protein